MIVDTGKAVIVDFFGGQVGHIGDYIALGTGTTAVTSADTTLETEAVRVAVSSISADTTNSRIIFKAVVQPGSLATISEVGVYYNGAIAGAQLVCRTVLDTPISVDPDVPTEIEYSLELSV